MRHRLHAPEALEVKLARLHAREIRALVLLRAERGEDRRGRCKELSHQAQAAGDIAEHLLHPLRGVAERVQRAAQPEQERDRGVFVAGMLRRRRQAHSSVRIQPPSTGIDVPVM